MRTWLRLLVLIVALAGCGPVGGPSVSSAGTTDAPDRTGSTSGLTPEPSLAPGEGRPLCGQDSVPCEIGEGTYIVDRFSHPFTFTTEDDWLNEQNWAEGGELRMGELGALRNFGWAAKPANANLVPFASADKLKTYLSRLGDVELSESEAATVGGVAATRFDMETMLFEDGIAAPFVVENAQFLVREDRQVRFWVLERGGELVVLLAHANTGEHFKELQGRVEPMIESITWE